MTWGDLCVLLVEAQRQYSERQGDKKEKKR